MINQIFMYEGAQVRTVIKDGEPHWVAKDVCDILGFSNNRDAISRLDEDEKGVATTDTLGGSQEVAIINESGLYSLILGSKKPEAKPFKRWITHDVIPSIRKNGAYSLQPQFPLPQTMPEALRLLAAEMESKAIIAAEKEELAIETAEQKQKLKEQEAPVAIYNLAISAGNAQSMSVVAKALGTGRNRLFDDLRDHNIIMKNSRIPYQKFIDAGYFIVRESPRQQGDAIVNEPVTKVTAKGFDYIARLISKQA